MPAPLQREDGSATVILDLTRLGPGGYCTAAARGLGARVIKVEDPGPGDYAREVRMLPGSPPPADGISEFFRMLSRGKESVVLDLKSESGRAAFLALVEEADAVVEAFRPGVLERLGLGWPTLRERNPRLILCSITAFGQDSPLSGEAAHDINVMGLSGLLSAIAAGRRAGSGGEGPEIVGIQLGDAVAGLTGIAAILAGLVGRAEHGRGAWVDVSMFDALLSLPTVEAAELAEAGRVAAPGEGMLDGAFAGYNLYRAADDGWLAVGAFEPKFWRRFCELLERPDWIELQHDRDAQENLKGLVAERIAGRPLADWAKLFAGEDCCVSPVRGFDQALADEHARHRRLWRGDDGFEQPLPFSFVDGFEAVRGGEPPSQGEQTVAVLEDLGVDRELIAAVAAEGP
jgi:alpha-methylacyl-CoA racemase